MSPLVLPLLPRSDEGRPAGAAWIKIVLALGLLWGAAGPAGAEESMFSPRTRAGPSRVQAEDQETGAAGRPAAFSGLFAPRIKAGEQGRRDLADPGEEEWVEGEKPAPDPRRIPVLYGIQGGERPYWEIEARKGKNRGGERPYWEIEARRGQNQGAGKPYWEVEADKEAPPYFQAEEKKPEPPYWQERENPAASSPYWQAREAAGAADRERPYWEPEPERVEIIVPAFDPSAAPPPAPPEPAGNPLSYFMYQDEFGMKHLTNVPVDPRYREFAVTVRVQRGLAGVRAGPLRFTHENLRPLILRAARTYNLDPALIAAVIRSESAFDAHAVSWAGAQGLMQLMPETARDMDCADPFDPAQNIMAGSRYLRLMLDTFGGDLDLAVAAYNCGPEQVSRLWRVPDIAETKNYVIIVSRNYERYKGRL